MTGISVAPSSVIVGGTATPTPATAALGACSSASPGVSTVSGNLVQAVASGTALITCGSLTATLTVTPPAAVLTDLIITCPESLAGGAQGKCSATAVYNNGATQPVTVTWSAANPAALGVDPSGNVSAKGVAVATSVTVTATYTEGAVTKTKQANIAITPSPLGACAGGGPYTMLLTINGARTPTPLLIKPGETVVIEYCMAGFDGVTPLDVYIVAALSPAVGDKPDFYAAKPPEMFNRYPSWEGWDGKKNPPKFLPKNPIKNQDAKKLIDIELPAYWPKGTTNVYIQAVRSGDPPMDTNNWSKLWSLGVVSFTY